MSTEYSTAVAIAEIAVSLFLVWLLCAWALIRGAMLLEGDSDA